MIKEAIGFGDTIEEALEQAKSALNAKAEDDIQFDVISTPKKKILGLFGGAQAEVKAYIELPDEKPKKSPKKKKENKEIKENKENKETAKADKKPQKAEKKPATKNELAPAEELDLSDAVDADSLQAGTQSAKAVAYLRSVLKERFHLQIPSSLPFLLDLLC